MERVNLSIPGRPGIKGPYGISQPGHPGFTGHKGEKGITGFPGLFLFPVLANHPCHIQMVGSKFSIKIMKGWSYSSK